MQQIDNSLINGFKSTSRLILEECFSRQWSVYCNIIGDSHLYIDRGDGRLMHIYSSISPKLKYVDGMGANNKYFTYMQLKNAGIAQASTWLCNKPQDTEPIVDYMRNGNLVVVKPLDGSHGNGITLGVCDAEQLERALKYARVHSPTGASIVQEQVGNENNYDIRLLCIDGTFIGAIHRVPARVEGDGISSVEQLLVLENENTKRGDAYRHALARIDTERALRYLKSSTAYVPKKGELVRVMDVANYGAGGETVDVTDEVPDWMVATALKASAVLGLPVAGIDMMLTKPVAEADPGDGVIIEVNKGPSLYIHDHPTAGINRGATAAYVNYLEML